MTLGLVICNFGFTPKQSLLTLLLSYRVCLFN